MITGYSWCAKCDQYAEFALTGYNEPCQCHDGRGRMWKIKDGGVCACGEPRRWMHQPPPEPLEWSIEIPQRKRVPV